MNSSKRERVTSERGLRMDSSLLLMADRLILETAGRTLCGARHGKGDVSVR
jgi:hypothetical protein